MLLRAAQETVGGQEKVFKEEVESVYGGERRTLKRRLFDEGG